jgi:hypothetical protein
MHRDSTRSDSRLSPHKFTPMPSEYIDWHYSAPKSSCVSSWLLGERDEELIKMDQLPIVKVLAILSGVILALLDPITFMHDFRGVYPHMFRRLCWIALGMGLSQFVAHLYMMRVYFCEIYQPGVSDKMRQQLHMVKNMLGTNQLLCAFMMGFSMIWPLIAALDWLPLKWWFGHAVFFYFTDKEDLFLKHIVAETAVPIFMLACNIITSAGIDKVNRHVDWWLCHENDYVSVNNKSVSSI